MTDRRVLACNYTEGTKIAPKGALAYLVISNPGNGHDRIVVLVRSHGGRWVEKWESMARLGNFRLKTLPPEHPLYRSDRIQDSDEAKVAELSRAKSRIG